MDLKKKVFSKLDSTIKYVFVNDDNFTLEFSYINKNDGKDIICAPSQTMCKMMCKFCHCTDHIGKIKSENLKTLDLEYGIQFIIDDLKLSNDKMLLISFMGIGEPIINWCNIIAVMMHFYKKREMINIRFAVATAIPSFAWLDFFNFTNSVQRLLLPVKLHLSLHYTDDINRKEWMPSSLFIKQSLAAVDFYRLMTGNKVEIHYTLIDGLNDSEYDAATLALFLLNKNMDVKFLFFNEKESLDYHRSNKEKLDIFKKQLDAFNIKFEYYIPPGLDVGASCGQFFMDNYIN